MKRFYHEHSNSWLKQLVSIAFYLSIFFALLFALSGVSDKTTAQKTESLKQSISRSIAHCYATEGQYPESLEYLQEHYGIRYDTEQYFIDYQVLGENIFPDITIIEK